MTRKRTAIVSVLLVAVLGPAATVAVVPALRRRVRTRWDAHRLRSRDAATRKAAAGAVVERGGPELEELFPEVVAAAVMDVESRSVIVAARGEGGRQIELWNYRPLPAASSPSVIGSVDGLRIERSLEASPVRLILSSNTVTLLHSPTTARALWVTEGNLVRLVVPLEGERGERILAAVEERLREGR